DFELRGAPPDLQLKWDEGSPHRLSAIPAAFLSPRPLGARAWWLRAWLPGLVTITTAVWSVVIVWLLWRLVRRVLPLGDVLSTPSVRWSLAASALLFLVGVWWGWPGGGWAPDEFDPGAVFDAWARRFSGGWHGGVYPPMQFYLLTIVDAPALIAGWLHLTTLRLG